MAEEQKKVVLVVEDELPLQNAIRIKLERGGFLVALARSVDQALKHLEGFGNIDIIWIDHYLLGDKTGLDLVGKLKENDDWKNIPLFVVSNTASSDKIKEYMDSGVENCYMKSNHHLKQIIEDIRKVLKNSSE